MNRWELVGAEVSVVPEDDPRLLERVDVALPAKDRPILAAAVGCRAAVLPKREALALLLAADRLGAVGHPPSLPKRMTAYVILRR